MATLAASQVNVTPASETKKPKWPSYSETVRQKAFTEKKYIKAILNGPGYLAITGAERAWKTPGKADYVYLPDLLIAGHENSVRAYLDYLVTSKPPGISVDVRDSALANAYTRSSIAINQVLKNRFDLEVAAKRSLRKKPGEPAEKAEITPEQAVLLVQALSIGKQLSKVSSISVPRPRAAVETARGRGRVKPLGTRIKSLYDENTLIKDKNKRKYLDVTKLNTVTGSGARMHTREKLGENIVIVGEGAKGIPIAARAGEVTNYAFAVRAFRDAAPRLINDDQVNNAIGIFQQGLQPSVTIQPTPVVQPPGTAPPVLQPLGTITVQPAASPGVAQTLGVNVPGQPLGQPIRYPTFT